MKIKLLDTERVLNSEVGQVFEVSHLTKSPKGYVAHIIDDRNDLRQIWSLPPDHYEILVTDEESFKQHIFGKYVQHPIFKVIEKIAKKRFGSCTPASTIIHTMYKAAQHAKNDEELEEVLYNTLDVFAKGYDEAINNLTEYARRYPQRIIGRE